MVKRNQMLVFDFDGVISNSIHDSYVSALNTYIQVVDHHGLPLTCPISPAKDIFRFEKAYPDLFRQFQNLLPMGNRAEDYYVFLQIMDQNRTSSIQDQESFSRFKADLSRDKMDIYWKQFYTYRWKQQAANPEIWSELLPSFPGVVDGIKVLSSKFILAIATSKDRKSVDLQLNHYGLTHYFQNHILDKDFSESKREHLFHFHQDCGIPLASIHFIDDKVHHLLSVKDLGVSCYLAGWGFNSAREHEIAQKEGFPVLSLKDLHELGD